jgi:peptide/nickel transport system substrate-binding protein
MHRTAPFILAAALAIAATSAEAAPFTCPKTGGSLTFGQEANVNSLDQMASNTISTRNVAMNIFEALLTRSETNETIGDLADSWEESPDKLTYTFKLRPGIHFQNGKEMTSADVVASFDRYSKVGLERSNLANVASWDAPDPLTFVIHMKKPQPTFIESMSSFSVPIVIIPAEYKDDPPLRLHTIGTGPWMLDEFVPGGYVRLKRFDGYKPNTHYEGRTGFGGYKVACLDTVTVRIVTEPSARVAGLRTGELQGVEDVPATDVDSFKGNKDVTLLPLKNWWIQITTPNVQKPPTDNLYFRQAVMAVLNMDDIMDAASDGNYSLNVGFQYPGRPGYTDAGKETYNQKNPAKAKELLAKAGYKGEPVVILTNKDYTSMFNAAEVQAEEMKSVGINAQIQVVDWPTSIQMFLRGDTGWNYFHTGWGTQPALGALSTMAFFAPPNATYRPAPGKDDPDVVKLWNDMNDLPTADERQDAFVKLQALVLDRGYAVPFGSLTKVQAVRSNVKGFVPFRIPRFSNVWLEQ